MLPELTSLKHEVKFFLRASNNSTNIIQTARIRIAFHRSPAIIISNSSGVKYAEAKDLTLCSKPV
jgi:hypothetical protein